MNTIAILILIVIGTSSGLSIHHPPLNYEKVIEVIAQEYDVLEFDVDHLQNYNITVFQGSMMYIKNNDRHNITLKYDGIGPFNIGNQTMYAPLTNTGVIEITCKKHPEEYGNIKIIERAS